MSDDGPVFTDLADLVGKPLEAGFKRLPPDVSDPIGETVRAAPLKGLDVAVLTVGKSDARALRDLLHNARSRWPQHRPW